MQAYFSTGIRIVISEADKEIGEKTGKLECSLAEWKKAKVILHIVPRVRKKGFLNEPGFYIEAVPKNVGPEGKTKYEMWLSEERFRELTNPKDLIEGGYFLSRSLYDRIEMSYYGI